MSRVFAKYINRDIGLNHNKCVVSYLRQYLCQEGMEAFRDVVFAIPGRVYTNFDEIIALGDEYNKSEQVNAVLLARACTHSLIKAKVLQKFSKSSIPYTRILTKDMRSLANNRILCKYIDFSSSCFSMYDLKDIITRNSPAECIDHFIDGIWSGDRGRDDTKLRLVTQITSVKPAMIARFTEKRFRKMENTQILRLLESWHSPRVLKAIIENEIVLNREASDYVGEMMTMRQVSGAAIPIGARKIYRILSS
jgi:hypothetical protein